jgi:hypothetical protein
MQSVIGGMLAVFYLASSATAQETKIEFCRDWGDFAYLQMKWRQEGVPFSDAIEAARAAALGTDSVEVNWNISKAIVQAAYNEPLAQTDRMMEVKIIEFSERQYAICMAS